MFPGIEIIKYIYIAQDREEAANALGNNYTWNRNVLSLFLRTVSACVGQTDRRSDGIAQRDKYKGDLYNSGWLIGNRIRLSIGANFDYLE